MFTLFQPPALQAPYLPFPRLPFVPLEEKNNGYGLAQQLCRERGAQGRLLWIDATANIDRVNTAEKIAALVTKIKSVGFNTIVFDVKPILGEVLYPSAFAPKLTEWVRPWATYRLPADFDPLKVMSAECQRQGLSLTVSLNAFSEGHREFPLKGLAVEKPEWQTVLYENSLKLGEQALGERPNVLEDGKLAIFTDLSKLPKLLPGSFALALDKEGTVVAQLDGPALATLAPSGTVLVAAGGASADYLKARQIGEKLSVTLTPRLVRLGELPVRQIPLMTSPHHPEVRQRLLNILKELATNYELDGVIFDDRLRFAALNADFSDNARREFEAWLGKPVESWPTDIFRWEVQWPELTRRWPVPGPLYESWLTFRAQTLRRFVVDAAQTVKTAKPNMTFATYVGSWYPDYPDLGANWAADDLQAGFHFLSDSYRATGWAGLTDFVVTGCYYKVPSIREAALQGKAIGDTVEAAGQFSNRAVNDQTFVYAGLSLDAFKGKPEELKKVLQAACATTQGVMCFDLSHDIEPLWPVFAEAFQRPAVAPHTSPALRAELKKRRGERQGPPPAVILYRGTSGTGF